MTTHGASQNCCPELREFIRRQADQGYSFVDCLSFCVMKERGLKRALTTDEHFRKAGFEALLLA